MVHDTSWREMRPHLVSDHNILIVLHTPASSIKFRTRSLHWLEKNQPVSMGIAIGDVIPLAKGAYLVD